MAYQVDKFNGQFFVSVADGTIDNTTDIRLVGKNYAGYGEVQNENFLHLLENFANTTAPPKRITGQIWYDSGTKKLKFYDGARFKLASGAEASETAPSGLTAGDFWFDTAAKQLYCWSGTEFILVGPEAAPEFGSSAAIGQVVQDTGGVPNTIVRLVSGGDTIAVVSKTEFDLASANPITGFSRIKKGITLVNTSATGSNAGVTFSDHIFWGTSSAAKGLINELGQFIATDNFVTAGNLAFESQASFRDAGFLLGDDSDIQFFMSDRDILLLDPLRDEDQAVISMNVADQPITFRIKINDTDQANILKIRSNGIFPGDTDEYKLGDTSKRWQEIHALTFIGNLTGNLTGNTSGGFHKGNVRADDDTVVFDSATKTFFGTLGSPEIGQRAVVYGDVIGDVTGSATAAGRLGLYSPSFIADGNTVAVRTSSGNLIANNFVGTADTSVRLKIDDSATDDVSSDFKSAKTTSTANTIVARDASSNIYAALFDGTATAARYADLAEKYLPDADYDVGTVVAVGGEKEITAASKGHRAIGVISENPAFMMNKELEGGVYVALKGRVPVKVIGKVLKGQRLISVDIGIACADDTNTCDVFAIALESSDEADVKLIEAVIL